MKFLAMSVLLCHTVSGGAPFYLLGDLEVELDTVGAIIEVGSCRGHGSTQFLSGLANRTRRSFFTVDFSEEGVRNARAACGACAYHDMGERWLEDEQQGFAAEAARVGAEPMIALAYLDNYDWTYPEFLAPNTVHNTWYLMQHRDYEVRGLSLTNAKSQEIHLLQAMAVAQRCSERCFILFDDTWAGAAAGLYSGKGGRAVGFLMANGFEVVQQSGDDENSHMGWVLLRQLPAHERSEPPPKMDADEMWNSFRQREVTASPAGTAVEILLPAQHAYVRGSELNVRLQVRGAVAGEHTLVTYLDRKELARQQHFDDFPTVTLPLCRTAVGADEGGGARGELNERSMTQGEIWELCSGAEASTPPPGTVGKEGPRTVGGDSEVLWVQHYEVLQTLDLGEGGAGIDEMVVMTWLLLDALHAQVAQASLTFTSNKRVSSVSWS